MHSFSPSHPDYHHQPPMALFFFWFWSTLDGCFGYFYFLLLTIIDFDGHLNVVSSIDRIKMFYVRKIQLRKIPVQFGLGRQLNTSSFEKIICAIPFDENLRAKRVYWWWHWYNAKGLSSCLLFFNLAMPWSIFFSCQINSKSFVRIFLNCHCCKKKKLRVSKIWNVMKKKENSLVARDQQYVHVHVFVHVKISLQT